jgi:hypothetical protein
MHASHLLVEALHQFKHQSNQWADDEKEFLWLRDSSDLWDSILATASGCDKDNTLALQYSLGCLLLQRKEPIESESLLQRKVISRAL